MFSKRKCSIEYTVALEFYEELFFITWKSNAIQNSTFTLVLAEIKSRPNEIENKFPRLFFRNFISATIIRSKLQQWKHYTTTPTAPHTETTALHSTL